MKDEILRDRLVVGIRHLSLLERMQLHPDLTLEKAKKTIRQCKAVKEQSILLQKDGRKPDETVLERVRTGG